MDLLKLKQSIIKNEGFDSKPYLCPNKKLTIGYGRNLENGITEREAIVLLENDLLNLKLELDDKLPVFKKLDDIRQNVILEMAYNMGVSNLLKFKNMIEALKKADYKEASKEMLMSKWHEDFKKYDLQDGKANNNGLLRSEYLSKVMKEGKY